MITSRDIAFTQQVWQQPEGRAVTFQAVHKVYSPSACRTSLMHVPYHKPFRACVVLQVAAQTEYDRVLEETQTAYKQIVQSSDALLDILQRECKSLGSTEQQRGQLLAC